jgi:hypothetical protein
MNSTSRNNHTIIIAKDGGNRDTTGDLRLKKIVGHRSLKLT